jgi:hypothetical protein
MKMKFKCFVFAVLFCVCGVLSTFAQTVQGDTVSMAISEYENFGLFLQGGRECFWTYFSRYNPQVITNTESEVVCTAQYGRYAVECRFYQEDGTMKIALTTNFDRDRVKWFNNIVKNVRQYGRVNS